MLNDFLMDRHDPWFNLKVLALKSGTEHINHLLNVVISKTATADEYVSNWNER